MLILLNGALETAPYGIVVFDFYIMKVFVGQSCPTYASGDAFVIISLFYSTQNKFLP